MQTIFKEHTQNADILFRKIQWVEGDILDFYLLDEIIQQHKEVYHAAAFVSFHKADHTQIMNVNVQGTINVVQACIKNNARLVYVSSISALGRGTGTELSTEDNYRNNTFKSSVYSESKYLAEQEVWRGMAEGLNAVIVNPSVILGSGDWSKSSTQLFKTVSNGLKFYTNGSNGYVDVRDVVEIMHQLMKSEIHSERFIVSAENID